MLFYINLICYIVVISTLICITHDCIKDLIKKAQDRKLRREMRDETLNEIASTVHKTYMHVITHLGTIEQDQKGAGK
jgi:hypothetical protein